MNPRTRELVDALLFLPVMALLAAAMFCGFYLVIRFGWLAMSGVTRAALALGLPLPAAMVLGVFATALAVYVVVPRAAVAAASLIRRLQRPRPR